MRIFTLLSLSIFILNGYSQTNRFVNYGNLSQLRQAQDDSYVGVDSTNRLVKLDHDFNLIWAIGPIDDKIDDVHIEPDGDIYVLSKSGNEARLTELDLNGTTTNRTTIAFDSFTAGAFERTPNGFVFLFHAVNAEVSSSGSLILLKTDFSFSTEWVKAIDPKNNGWSNYQIEANADTVTLMALTGYADTMINIMARFLDNGDLIWARHHGTNCSSFHHFTQLPTGEFVIVGEDLNTDNELARITVMSNTGDVLSTKEKHFSDSDWGSDAMRVVALSDGRYVISNTYVEGSGTGFAACLIYFDNHKPDGFWNYVPINIVDDNYYLQAWSADSNDQILITGNTYSFSIDSTESTMGRMTWKSEACGIGFLSASVFSYKLDTSEIYDLAPYSISNITWSSIAGTIPAATYSNTFFCENSATDSGPVETGDHLYGSPTTSCPMTFLSGELNSNLLSDNFVIYPNPSNGIIRVNLNGDFDLQIFEVSGRLVFSETNLNGALDVSHLSPGVYLVKIQTENLEWKCVRLVIE